MQVPSRYALQMYDVWRLFGQLREANPDFSLSLSLSNIHHLVQTSFGGFALLFLRCKVEQVSINSGGAGEVESREGCRSWSWRFYAPIKTLAPRCSFAHSFLLFVQLVVFVFSSDVGIGRLFLIMHILTNSKRPPSAGPSSSLGACF